MRRAGLLALCVSGVVAAVVLAQALVEHPPRNEAALSADGTTVRTPLLRLGDAPPLNGGAPMGAPRDAPRVDAEAEPKSGREPVSALDEVTRTDDDPFAVTIELDVQLPGGSRSAHALLTFVPRDRADARHGGARRELRNTLWRGACHVAQKMLDRFPLAHRQASRGVQRIAA